ncbi:hypothetical protein [Roseococcus thiosulfatophilus]|uniref:hypothetical protein n=1 Tax=Roseococcus thiosulfatophilus TaxID=35813 RepID=UPI001A8CBCF6|nr:hypothetical protein [Roseococcus thiosulfatophilus]
MRHLFRPMMAAALLAVAAAGTAAAQSFPRVVAQGDSFTVDYGPMGQGNVVGGGRVMVSQSPDGMQLTVVHLDAMFSQQPRPGFVPLSIGSGEGLMVIYVPAMMVEQMRRALGAMAR